MAYYFRLNDNGDNFPVLKQKACTTSETYAIGSALIVDSSTNNVRNITGTETPTYISMELRPEAMSASQLTVTPIYAGQEWVDSTDGHIVKF